MEGTVVKRLHIGSSTRNGQPCFYGIYNVQTATHTQPVRFMCMTHSFVERGDYLKAARVSAGQSQYGPHFEADRSACAQTMLPQVPLEIEKRLKSICKSLPGMGPKKLMQFSSIGPSVWSMLQGASDVPPSALSGINPAMLGQIKAAFSSYMENKSRLPKEDALADLRNFFDGIGIQWPDSLLINIITMCHDTAAPMDNNIASLIQVIRTDPLRLFNVCNIGVQRIRQLVDALDLNETDRWGVEIVMQLHTLCMQGGHTCQHKDILSGACAPSMQGEIDRLLSELVTKGIIVMEGPYVFLKDLWKCEEGTRRLVGAIQNLDNMNNIYAHTGLEDCVQNVLDDAACFLGENQKQAVRMVFQNPLSIICGGAGTGKTTVVKTVLDILIQAVGQKEQPPLHIHLIAPTGKAVTRLLQTTGHIKGAFPETRVDIMTVHKLIAQYKKEPDDATSTDKCHHLYVLDEASMVDIEICYQFLNMVNSRGVSSTTILLGDTHQLPSVGPGNVLHDMLTNGCPYVELTVIHRQEKIGALTQTLAQLRRMRDAPHVTLSKDWNDKTLTLVPLYEWTDIKEYIKERAMKRKSKFEEMLFITPINVNVDELQPLIRDTINPSSSENTPFPKLQYRLHDRVMQTKNNYDKNVFNGMIGRVVEIREEVERKEYKDGDGKHVVPETIYRLRIDMDDMDAPVWYTYDEAMAELRHAYISTVHKAQGSEAKEVVLVLGRCGKLSLYRNMLYTALSRAKQRVVVVGPPEAIHSASTHVMLPRQTWASSIKM
jgi:exodeoxyribonuclease V alpha subunit